MTEDENYFGKHVLIYCNQHLNPHYTGWCTVSVVSHKWRLDAKTMEDAIKECRERGFKLYDDVRVGPF